MADTDNENIDGDAANQRSDDADKPRQGYRKDGQPYKQGNTRDDGGYEVGKNRPPEDGKFRAGDGRRRGRRKKGEKNVDTEFAEELNSTVVVTENGKKRRLPKRRIIHKVLIENATKHRDSKAIAMVYDRMDRIEAKQEASRQYHTLSDLEILDAYFRERAAELNLDPNLFGDPEPDAEDSNG